MAVEKYEPGIGIAAGLLMLKWDFLDREFGESLQPGQDVNVFINFESIMENITHQRPLTSTLVYYKQDITLELESAVLNMIAHYRAYFRHRRCNPRIFLYYTDLKNTEPQQMSVYSKYYREFYKNQFLQNPKYRAIGELLVDVIIPEIKLILSYVQGCYFITSDTFDSSIIPMIISNIKGGQNCVITSDLFDSLYLYNKYKVFYIQRKYKTSNISTDIDGILQSSIFKSENVFDVSIFHQEMYYQLLLAIIGSNKRNIGDGSGINANKLLTLLKGRIDSGNILKDYISIESIIHIFPTKQQEEVKSAFQCMSLETHYSLLGDSDIENINCQIVDKFDQSISTLNDNRFREYQINLQSLLY